jgi:hypothetical protein
VISLIKDSFSDLMFKKTFNDIQFHLELFFHEFLGINKISSKSFQNKTRLKIEKFVQSAISGNGSSFDGSKSNKKSNCLILQHVLVEHSPPKSI